MANNILHIKLLKSYDKTNIIHLWKKIGNVPSINI